MSRPTATYIKTSGILEVSMKNMNFAYCSINCDVMSAIYCKAFSFSHAFTNKTECDKVSV